MPKIIAVCPEEYPGVSAVFKHGAALNLWEHRKLNEFRLEKIPENDFVILGAWHPSYIHTLEKHNCVVFLTSTFGQMEFSNNQVEIKILPELINLVKTGKIKAIIAGWEDVANYFLEKLPGQAFYSPYPFAESLLTGFKENEKEPNSLGIFLPCAPRKNTINQILAAIKSGMKIYTNLPYYFKEASIEQVNWLEDHDYFRLISKIKLTLHCTFTESYSYAAAESLILGTLPIVSLQISQNLSLLQDLVCYQCDSVSSILEKINRIKNLDEFQYNEILRRAQWHFRFRNKINIVQIKDVLDKITELVVK